MGSGRLVLLGTRSAFSRAVLEGLLRLGRPPAALLVPVGQARAPALRVLLAPDAASLARQHGIPVVEACGVEDLALPRLEPDWVCAACFPWRLPGPWRAAARRGCLNLHPSLLPAYRGPAPLFWQLRDDARETGVTLHMMDEGLDTGDLVARQPVELPDELVTAEAELRLGQAGAALLEAALAVPVLARQPQPEPGASRQPWPGPPDLRLDPSWSARRAFRFLRGAQAHGPFEVGRLRVAEAVGLPGPGGPRPGPGELDLRFADGWLRVRRAT
jgi:methionyl-tRNA formyltransferase